MGNARPLELMSARSGPASPSHSRRNVIIAAIACGWLQGCFLFQQPAQPIRSVEKGMKRPSATSPTPSPPAVVEETLPPEREIEGPPLPPNEDEIVGPPAPSAAPPASGEQVGPPSSEEPVQQAYASPRTQALLDALTRKGLAARACARGVVILLPESVFDYGTADLPKVSKRHLHDIAGVVVEQVSGVPVAVEGHTDSIGADLFNQGLSERRARAVANELAAGGIAQSLLSSAGFGARFPIAPNERPDGSDDPDGRARNRRVEIVIETEGAPHG
jgi:outer membrane protein OmpA-like peptidoglycan-associated protein